MIVRRQLRLFVVRKDHIRAFAESENSLPAPTAQALRDLVSITNDWITHQGDDDGADDDDAQGQQQGQQQEHERERERLEYLEGRVNFAQAYDEKLLRALETIKSQPEFPSVLEPGSITRQRQMLQQTMERLDEHPVVVQSREGDVLDALTYAAQLKDPMAFVNGSPRSSRSTTREGDVFAWIMFQNVVSVLQDFGALEHGTNATQLGDLVSSITGDNELWLALVLRHPIVQGLGEEDFAALVSALMVDGFKLTNAFFQHEPSFALKVNSIRPSRRTLILPRYVVLHQPCVPLNYFSCLTSGSASRADAPVQEAAAGAG